MKTEEKIANAKKLLEAYGIINPTEYDIQILVDAIGDKVKINIAMVNIQKFHGLRK